MPGHLTSPPIVEVVCGVLFEQNPEIDPILLGAYWDQRRDMYPGRQLQPAITEPGTFVLGPMPPGRVWMLSADAAWVVQLQADRFYVNWRKRGPVYPRFSPRAEDQSMLSRVTDEYQRFLGFCEQRLGVSPVAKRIELAKIDHFLRPQHWQTAGDLVAMLPILRELIGEELPGFSLKRTEAVPGGKLSISLASDTPDPSNVTRINLETRVVIDADNRDVDALMREANQAANQAFDDLVPKAEHVRFMGAANE